MAGKKKRPEERGLIHGLYARRTRSACAEAMAEYAQAGDELYSLDMVTARAWVSMEHLDRAVEKGLAVLDSIGAVGSHDDSRGDAHGDGEGEAPTLTPIADGRVTYAEAMRSVAAMMKAAEGGIARLESLMLTRHKMTTAGDGAISRIELVAMLRLMTSWVRELSADDDVPRERIADHLSMRLQAYADAQQRPPAGSA